jgi:lycopene beta-cyclase
MADRADLVVIGGGLAGLSLAMRLAQLGYGGRVRIIEPRQHYEDDRSWAFWTTRGSVWAASATRTWDRWRFSMTDGESLTRSAEGWCYAYVRSEEFYQAALRTIAGSPNITLLTGTRAADIEALGDDVHVSTTGHGGILTARHVVDTRSPSASQCSAATLFQSFVGHELRLSQPGFDAEQVELMTDMRCDARGFVFSYVLALSPTRALVEVTRFTPQPIGAAELAPDLESLLDARGWSHAERLRSESATLPMGLPAPAGAGTLRGVVRAGIGGGALRAASGYGFLRIQAWADSCADALVQGCPPVGHPDDPPMRCWMDRLFLRVLASHPARTPEFFLRLASSVPGPAFVRFMSDQAGWADHGRIIAALPPVPFLQALRARPRRTRLPA